MKKKRFSIVLTLVLTLCIAALWGCGGNGGGESSRGDKIKDNPEFAEYARIVTAVAETFNTTESEKTLKSKADAVIAAKNGKPLQANGTDRPRVEIKKSASPADMLAILKDAPDKADENIASLFQDAFNQSLYIPLICGDIVTVFHNAKTFYGVSIGISAWQQTLMTESEGTKKITYVYSPADGGSDTFLTLAVDFRSETDFDFECLQTDEGNGRQVYIYGNSARRFLFAEFGEDESYAVFADGSAQGYRTTDGGTLSAFYETVKEDFAAIDREKIRSTAANPAYTVSEEEWEESAKEYKLFDKMEVQKAGFIVTDGVVYGYYNDEPDCPADLTLPPEANALYYDFYIEADKVKTLTIPSTITAVKITKGELDQMTGDKDAEADETLVDCPLEYLRIRTRDHMPLEEIRVAQDSSLFKTDNSCLYSKEDDVLLYVPQSSSIVSLTLSNAKIAAGAWETLQNAVLPNLKTLDCEVSYAEGAGYSDPTLALLEGNGKRFRLEKLTIHGVRDDYELRLTETVDGIDTLELFGEGRISVREEEIRADFAIRKIVLGEGVIGFDGVFNLAETEAEIVLPESLEELSLLRPIKETSVTIHCPFSGIGFTIRERYKLLGETMPLDIPYEALEYAYGRAKLLFLPPSETDKLEIKNLSDFPNHYLQPDDSDPTGTKWVMFIEEYAGTDTVVTVPKTLLGYRVAKYYYKPLAGVKELRLPDTLTAFAVNGEGDVLDKIVYEGTKENFLEIVGGAGGLSDTLSITLKIVCKDGEFVREVYGEKEEFTFGVDYNADTTRLTAQVDWVNGSLAFTLEIDDKKFANHKIEGFKDFDYLYFDMQYEPDPILGEDWSFYRYSLYFSKSYTDYGNGYGRNNLDAEITVFDDYSTYQKFEFSITDRTVYEGEVAHVWGEEQVIAANCSEPAHKERQCLCGETEKYDFVGDLGEHTYVFVKTVAPTCADEGYTLEECRRCQSGSTRKVDIVPPTGIHSYDEEGLCTVCSRHEYLLLEDGGFWSVTGLRDEDSPRTEITIPGSLRGKSVQIQMDAFKGNTALKKAVIACSIGEYAFSGCSSLEQVLLLSGVGAIGRWAFQNCTALTEITIPVGLTYINGYAFSGTASLVSVTFAEPEGWHTTDGTPLDLTDPKKNAETIHSHTGTMPWTNQ